MSFTPHQAATYKMPPNFEMHDFANGAANETTQWLDFKKARGAFVPRVLLVHLKTAYLSKPSLEGAVDDIVESLRPGGVRVSVSKAQRICNGKLVGWYLAYNKPHGDPPGQYENVLFMKGDTVYRVMYSRPDGRAEDARTRAALDTFCPLDED